MGMMLWHLIMAELCLNCTALRMCEVSKQQCSAAEKLDLKWGDEGKQREKHLVKTVVVPGRKLDSSGGAKTSVYTIYPHLTFVFAHLFIFSS